MLHESETLKVVTLSSGESSINYGQLVIVSQLGREEAENASPEEFDHRIK